MRKILIAAAALIAIAAGAVFFLVSNLDSLVKAAIEKFGTQVAGVPVKVGAVRISLREGRGSITGLTVANPAGFTSPTAFALGEVSLALDGGTVTKPTIVIKDVLVSAPQVTYELGQGGSNIAAIQKNVQAFTAGQAGAKPAASQDKGTGDKAAQDGKGEAKKLIIDQLLMKDGKVTLATPIPGAAASAALGEIRLTGIGRAKDGASAAEVGAQVLQAIANASAKAASGLGAGSLVKGLEGAAGSAGTGVQGGLDQVKGLLGK